MDVQNTKVFVNKKGQFGDLVPIILDEGSEIPSDKRVEIATSLNGVETAFVNSLETNAISIVHSQGEIPFAGTVAIGAAWFLSEEKSQPIKSIQGRDDLIEVQQHDGITWVKADLSTMPDWNLKQLDSAEEVEALKVANNTDVEHTMFWAWISEEKGLIRARTFAPDWDIPEAEANGSGAMILASSLNREIQMTQGKGSVVFAKPESENHASVGGRVVKQ